MERSARAGFRWPAQWDLNPTREGNHVVPSAFAAKKLIVYLLSLPPEPERKATPIRVTDRVVAHASTDVLDAVRQEGQPVRADTQLRVFRGLRKSPFRYIGTDTELPGSRNDDRPFRRSWHRAHRPCRSLDTDRTRSARSVGCHCFDQCAQRLASTRISSEMPTLVIPVPLLVTPERDMSRLFPATTSQTPEVLSCLHIDPDGVIVVHDKCDGTFSCFTMLSYRLATDGIRTGPR